MDRYRHLVSRIIAAINKHDPIGLRAMGASDDEYEPQARAIAGVLLREGADVDYAAVVSRVFAASFGESAEAQPTYTELAEEIAQIVQAPKR